VLAIVGVHFAAHRKERVDHYVFDAWHEVFLNLKSVLPKFLGDVLLQLVEAERVALFEGTIRFVFHLQTLVGKVDKVVFVVQVVF
jgi:hypothetical protein